ncbi:hypothetical protein Bca4012_072603 [Brassica carinata]|uniref:Uncharacterized protein n=1 Tax=Brassica carinata TaxID=52824 RepID=A0A8X7QHC9_BRACI|nr:hypothetical protein Bca52824_064971 [Brassica carinata]
MDVFTEGGEGIIRLTQMPTASPEKENLTLAIATGGVVGHLHAAKDKGKGIATEPDTHGTQSLNLHTGLDSGDARFGLADAGNEDDDCQLLGSNFTFDK